MICELFAINLMIPFFFSCLAAGVSYSLFNCDSLHVKESAYLLMVMTSLRLIFRTPTCINSCNVYSIAGNNWRDYGHSSSLRRATTASQAKGTLKIMHFTVHNNNNNCAMELRWNGKWKETTHVDRHLLLLITRRCNLYTYLFIPHTCFVHLSRIRCLAAAPSNQVLAGKYPNTHSNIHAMTDETLVKLMIIKKKPRDEKIN